MIVFDHRGFGQSRCPDDAFSPEHFPGDLLAILDAERIERAALVCQSMGGWTGLPTAVRHPELAPATLVRLFNPENRLAPADLDGFSVPTLVISGEHDLLFAPKILREIADLIPGAELRDFPDVGHSGYFEEPERFNHWVGDFIQRHP